jgi:hypothetical protein
MMTDVKMRTNFDACNASPVRVGCSAVCCFVVGMFLFSALGGWLPGPSYGADPAPQPTSTTGTAVPRLPMIDVQGPQTHVQGKIVRSSRGRKGPVRLLVERKPGDQVTVLVGPDEECDRLGLSLQSGETVDVEGALVKGERPILIASAFKTADGKTVRIRDATGKLIEPAAPASATGGNASGGGGTASKPSLSGAKPPPSPVQK